MERRGWIIASILCVVLATVALLPIVWPSDVNAQDNPVEPGVEQPKFEPNIDPAEDPEAALDALLKGIDEDPAGAAKQIVKIAKDLKDADDESRPGLIQSLIALGLMFLIWIVRKFVWTSLPAGALPWVALSLGTVTETMRLLAAGTVPWWQALISGLVTGAFAIALWSAVGKRFLPTDK